MGENMEDEINECEDEYYHDPTLLTFQIDGNIMFNGGLEFLCKQQEFTGESMHIELKDYDVVISVTKPRPKPPEIVCLYRTE
jgi:hypothetical protein